MIVVTLVNEIENHQVSLNDSYQRMVWYKGGVINVGG